MFREIAERQEIERTIKLYFASLVSESRWKVASVANHAVEAART